MADAKVAALRACKAEVMELCKAHHCNPILVRLAWHDSGTFNKDSPEMFPRYGGANGSIRFEPEINHGANAGLTNALQLLQPIKDKHPEVGWADLIQLASATAIEEAGGPVIDMKYGRKDAATPQGCPDEGNLPAGNAPFPDADTPQVNNNNTSGTFFTVWASMMRASWHSPAHTPWEGRRRTEAGRARSAPSSPGPAFAPEVPGRPQAVETPAEAPGRRSGSSSTTATSRRSPMTRATRSFSSWPRTSACSPTRVSFHSRRSTGTARTPSSRTTRRRTRSCRSSVWCGSLKAAFPSRRSSAAPALWAEALETTDCVRRSTRVSHPSCRARRCKPRVPSTEGHVETLRSLLLTAERLSVCPTFSLVLHALHRCFWLFYQIRVVLECRVLSYESLSVAAVVKPCHVRYRRFFLRLIPALRPRESALRTSRRKRSQPSRNGRHRASWTCQLDPATSAGVGGTAFFVFVLKGWGGSGRSTAAGSGQGNDQCISNDPFLRPRSGQCGTCAGASNGNDVESQRQNASPRLVCNRWMRLSAVASFFSLMSGFYRDRRTCAKDTLKPPGALVKKNMGDCLVVRQPNFRDSGLLIGWLTPTCNSRLRLLVLRIVRMYTAPVAIPHPVALCVLSF